jgi:ABC-type uncharacterized transport system YnjBCD ATPase subunit
VTFAPRVQRYEPPPTIGSPPLSRRPSVMLGVDAPDAGHARIGGRRYRELRRPLREVGALLEAQAFHPGRSAGAYLTALAAANQIPRSRVDEVLDLVGLAGVARRRAGGFSLGMAQRLGLAAALLGAERIYTTLLGERRRRSVEGRSGILQFLARSLRSVTCRRAGPPHQETNAGSAGRPAIRAPDELLRHVRR